MQTCTSIWKCLLRANATVRDHVQARCNLRLHRLLHWLLYLNVLLGCAGQDQCYMAIRFLTDPALQAQLLWRIRPQLCAGCGSHLRPMLMHMESQHGLMAQTTENGLCLTKSRGKGLHDCNHSKSAVPVSSFIITRNRLYRVCASNVFDELRNRPQRDHLILLPNYDQCKLTNED